MSTQDFDTQQYSYLKHRAEVLKNRIDYKDEGFEKDSAHKMLNKILKKIKTFEEKHPLVVKNFNSSKSSMSKEYYNQQDNDSFDTTSNYDNIYYQEDSRSEEQISRDLGILYLIFGSTYCTTLNYHTYKIRFTKQAPKGDAFCKAYADIYEDNIKICSNILIGFWPWMQGDDRCKDMQFASCDSYNIAKYNNGCTSLYLTLLNQLKDLWNTYLDDHPKTPLIGNPLFGFLMNTQNAFQKPEINLPEVQLNKEQREEIIKQTEKAINNGYQSYLKALAHKQLIMSYTIYDSLSEFLDNSGVVYQVKENGIYILNDDTKNFEKLVGYDYSEYRYILYLY